MKNNDPIPEDQAALHRLTTSIPPMADHESWYVKSNCTDASSIGNDKLGTFPYMTGFPPYNLLYPRKSLEMGGMEFKKKKLFSNGI